MERTPPRPHDTPACQRTAGTGQVLGVSPGCRGRCHVGDLVGLAFGCQPDGVTLFAAVVIDLRAGAHIIKPPRRRMTAGRATDRGHRGAQGWQARDVAAVQSGTPLLWVWRGSEARLGRRLGSGSVPAVVARRAETQVDAPNQSGSDNRIRGLAARTGDRPGRPGFGHYGSMTANCRALLFTKRHSPLRFEHFRRQGRGEGDDDLTNGLQQRRIRHTVIREHRSHDPDTAPSRRQ